MIMGYLSIVILAALATGLFIINRAKVKLPHIICAAIIFIAAVAFVAIYKPNNKAWRKIEDQVKIDRNYVHELKEGFNDIDFKRVEKVSGIYVTSSDNKSTSNDTRIFIETQVKRTLRSSLSPFVPKSVKNKLSYFSQEEDKDEGKIYKLDDFQDLQSKEKYSIQNIGHATLLIQVPGFNILTDPVFYDLNSLLYPSQTSSHPSIKKLPRIDVILISHNHRDHVDQSSLQELLSHHQEKNWSQPRVFVPMGDKGLFEGFGFSHVEEVEWYTKISVTNEATINFISIPADHRSGRYGIDHHGSLVTGWIINPEQENVIFKFSGDTRSLSDENQLAVDALLWNEISGKKVSETEIPDIICLEPSGPNYTRCDMQVTHQSTSYSALLKFIEAKNFAKLSGKSFIEFLQKIQTIMMHHNKYELGPDRFNEGLFVFKKLLRYLDLNEEDLEIERVRQAEKLGVDKERLKKNTPFTSRFIIFTLPKHTSLLAHPKDFIIEEITDATKKIKNINKEQVIDKKQVKEYLIKKTIFPKIGERLNNEQVVNSRFNVESVQKYTREAKHTSKLEIFIKPYQAR